MQDIHEWTTRNCQNLSLWQEENAFNLRISFVGTEQKLSTVWIYGNLALCKYSTSPLASAAYNEPLLRLYLIDAVHTFHKLELLKLELGCSYYLNSFWI